MSADSSHDFEIVVHVGDGKTGTSAIQKTLRLHPRLLAEAGIQYLGLMLERAPVRKYGWQQASGIEAFHMTEPGKATVELADALRTCVGEARRAGINRVVWSNETLLGRSLPTIAALRELRDEGIRIVVVAYVRRHDGWARSAYLQWGLRHKTYEGPLRDFREWSAKRKFGLYPKLERWHTAFGEDLLVRNFDTLDDAAADFLELLGLDRERFKTMRSNEATSAEELALRALFNQQQPGRAAPARFNQLLSSQQIDFRLPLGQWLQELLPAQAELARIADGCADDRRKVDALLIANGQPPLASNPLPIPPMSLDHGALIAALFQILAQQAARLEKLEGKFDHAMASARMGGGDAVPAPGIAHVEPDVEIIAALAPSLGYFGPLAADCLELDVGADISEIRLSLAESKPTFLNLRGMELIRDGKPLVLSCGQFQAAQSSVAGGSADNGPDTLLTMKGIHSAAERSPWWHVEFSEPVRIDQLRLFNRSDGWSSRSRTLRVETVGADGQIHLVHQSQSTARLRHTLAAACGLAGQPLPDAWPATPAEAETLRCNLLSAIATRLRDRVLALKEVDWRALVPVLRVWGGEEPEPDEWTVIAALLLAQQQGKGGTSIKTFSLLLHSQTRLRRLQQEINVLAHVLDLGGFMLTRHGLKPEGVLRREPDKFVSHMEAVIAALRKLDREPVLAYGTLLGAVREADFIAHDDDIDLLYRSHRANRSEVESELHELKDALKAHGFRVVNLLPNSLNMHVIDPRNSAVMDVFPCWEENGKLQMHMESMKVRGIDPAIVYPAGEVEFLGRRLPAPARPADYLEERYGPGWNVSDQFFEWPWPLKDEATS